MNRLIITLLLAVALICTACNRRRAPKPISTSEPAIASVEPVTPTDPTPTFAAPPEEIDEWSEEDVTETSAVTPEIMPEETPEVIVEDPTVATAEAELEFAVEPDEFSTSEEELSTAEEDVIISTEEIRCFRDICLGMDMEEVKSVIASPEFIQDSKPKCRPGHLRRIRLTRPEYSVKRFLYINKCGGYMDHAEFYFFEGSLIRYNVFFSSEYLRAVKLDDFTKAMKKRLGNPYQESWPYPGKDGIFEWRLANYRATLKIFAGKPFVLKIRDMKAEDAALSKQKEAEENESNDRLEKIIQ